MKRQRNSHYGGGKGTKEYQDYLKSKFIEKYGLEERDFCQFFAKVIGGLEDTTRSRSFMFFSHAVVLASALDRNIEIIIPENGLISLNIPSTESRIGTSSTRTTHPHYMTLFQKLIDNLGLNVTFRNPYQFKTKGEIRQAAILRAGLEDTSSYRDRNFMMGPNEKMILNSYLLGLKKFNPSKAFMTIQMNGKIESNIDDYAALYVRGMEELKRYLGTVI